MRPMQLFTSATIKLTAWYLAILMAISLLFSVIVFQVSTSELDSRLGAFGYRLDQQRYQDLMPVFSETQNRQLHEAEITLFAALFYLNCVILVIGGVGSYALARKTLKPIEESHEAQARFASDASHELRTPLAVMRSELEVALRDPSLTKEEMHELLESNLDEVIRLSDLSQTLLQLSRHDYSQVSMKRVDIDDVIKATIKIHALDSARIRYMSPPKKQYTLANSDSIKELFMILFDNALRYSPARSIIDVSLIPHDTEHMTVLIRNTGKGISNDDLPHIFERFYRGDKSRTTSEGSGYGLGLSLAKKIADVHDAVIDITSKPDEYTVAEITFKKFQKS